MLIIQKFGKTISALALAYKFQEKVLVVCTNVDIRQMWEKEIEQFFGFKPGVIGSGRFEIDTPIVVSNIQSVRKKYQEVSDQFGMLVVDEAHHCCAATFDLLVMFSKARIKIGLTGTLKRKDGLHVTFPNYFGLKVYTPEERNTLPPTIHRYELSCGLPGNQMTPWALRINELYSYPEYSGTIKELANAYALLGHKVLVVNDRVEFLNDMYVENQVESFIITGDVQNRLEIQDLVAKHEGGCILWATQSIFSEGISLNELSCVILATPTNNESLVQQIVGRIQRIVEGKLDPVVVDILLSCNTGRRHGYMRKATYFMRGWEMFSKTKGWLAAQVKRKLNC